MQVKLKILLGLSLCLLSLDLALAGAKTLTLVGEIGGGSPDSPKQTLLRFDNDDMENPIATFILLTREQYEAIQDQIYVFTKFELDVAMLDAVVDLELQVSLYDQALVDRHTSIEIFSLNIPTENKIAISGKGNEVRRIRSEALGAGNYCPDVFVGGI